MSQSLVSIRELKSRLSHYLRLALSGESVVITERGVPIGRIVPIGQDIDQRLAAMREAGLAQWSGHKLRRRRPVAKLRGRKTVAQLLLKIASDCLPRTDSQLLRVTWAGEPLPCKESPWLNPLRTRGDG